MQKLTAKFFYLFLIIIFPIFLNAQSNISDGIVYECRGGRPGECTFQDLVNAVNRVINIATTYAVAFSVVVIAYAGFRYMRSGDNPSERTKANDMLKKVVIGVFFMLGAWLIVNFITSALGANNSFRIGI